MTQKLTPKQILFINEYLIDFNATRSAIAAGYSKKTARKIGQENLTKPDIQEAIAKAIEERNKRTEINADWVLKEAQDLYRECRAEGDRAQANRSLELIGRHTDVQAWLDRKEHKHINKYENMTTDELRHRLTELREQNAQRTTY